jgi:pimeloyl-ACP methyl ester carboxylesterase
MIPLPILLIHGFNGSPLNWTDPKDRFPEFLAEHGYDSELIRVFNYGYKETNGRAVYDSEGDLQELAHRLDKWDSDDEEAHNCSVDLLSRDSIARGGPARVIIIAHSSGGLIARYYLTCDTEDEFGTRYRGNVSHLIMLGAPHLGVDVEDLLDPLPGPTRPLIVQLLMNIHPDSPKPDASTEATAQTHPRDLRESAREEWVSESPIKNLIQDTPAFKQMHPDSDFLKRINRPGAMPREVKYSNIIGDIRYGLNLQLLRRRLFHGVARFGDFLVTTRSAGEIPNAESDCFAILDEHDLNIEAMTWPPLHVEVVQHGEHPVPIHRQLRRHPASRKRMLELLAAAAKSSIV